MIHRVGVRACIIDDNVLGKLNKLWAGGLNPEDLSSVEVAIRSYLLYEILLRAKGKNAHETPAETHLGFMPCDKAGGVKFPLNDDNMRNEQQLMWELLSPAERRAFGIG